MPPAPVNPHAAPTNLAPSPLRTFSPPTSTPSPSSTLLSKTQRFLGENQRLIILGCAVLAAGGAGYYLYTRSAGDAPPAGPSSPAGKKSKKKKGKKGGSSSEKFLKGEWNEGPLVEEITPPEAVGRGEKEEEMAQKEGTSRLNGTSVFTISAVATELIGKRLTCVDVPDADGLAAMSEAVRGDVDEKVSY